MKPLAITAFTAINCLGRGSNAMAAALSKRRGGLRRNDLGDAALETWIGRVDGLEDELVDGELAAFDCRNNRLAALTLRQDGFAQAVAEARDRYGAQRVAVFIGSSTAGIRETEIAYANRDPASGALPREFRYRETHNMYSCAEFVRRTLGLEGPAATLSTACSSSAKVFASAERLIDAGFIDAAVVGGVDSLCMMTLYGFHSLQLLSREPCRPCDAGRDGISIAEAAGFALLERAGANSRASGFALLGYGESSDAYHMSTPHPQGEGAVVAMRAALGRAGLEASAIDYVNMHGTGTATNDSAEDIALHRMFGGSVACSSTKGWTGHTLGAAGITEAVISLLCLREGFIPGSLNLRTLDPALRSRIAVETEQRKLRHVLSNSFGFGGNNCVLLFGAAP